MSTSPRSARQHSTTFVVFRFIGKALMRVSVVLSVVLKAVSGQANGFMEPPQRPRPPQREYRP